MPTKNLLQVTNASSVWFLSDCVMNPVLNLGLNILGN